MESVSTEDQSEKFFSAPRHDSGEKRIDFRKNSGSRFSLPYTYLVDVMHTTSGKLEKLALDYTNYWHVTLTGKNLLPIYKAIQGHDVVWVREAQDGEKRKKGETFVESIVDSKLTDPALFWESLQNQKKAIFEGTKDLSKI